MKTAPVSISPSLEVFIKFKQFSNTNHINSLYIYVEKISMDFIKGSKR